jgi:hypothetical protein
MAPISRHDLVGLPHAEVIFDNQNAAGGIVERGRGSRSGAVVAIARTAPIAVKE